MLAVESFCVQSLSIWEVLVILDLGNHVGAFIRYNISPAMEVAGLCFSDEAFVFAFRLLFLLLVQRNCFWPVAAFTPPRVTIAARTP
jgi:hypothetical protein